MKCANCGADLVADALFCMKCGARLVQSEDKTRASANSSEHENSVPVPESEQKLSEARRYVRHLRLFVKDNQDFYLSKWRRMDNSEGITGKLSVNWGAFLFGVFWLGFRKMYLFAFLCLFLLSLIGFLSYESPFSNLLTHVLGWAIYLGLGLVGNHIYRVHVDRKLAGIKSKYPDERTQDIVIAKNGGQVLGVSLQFPAPVVI